MAIATSLQPITTGGFRRQGEVDLPAFGHLQPDEYALGRFFAPIVIRVKIPTAISGKTCYAIRLIRQFSIDDSSSIPLSTTPLSKTEMDSEFRPDQERPFEWQPCQRGTILAPEVFREKREAGRKSALLQLSIFYGCGAVVVCAIIVSLFGDSNRINRNASPLPRQLSCSEMQEKILAYSQNAVSCCNERAAIAQHLNNCAGCDRQYRLLSENDSSFDVTCSEISKHP